MLEMFVVAMVIIVTLIALLFWVLNRIVKQLNDRVKAEFISNLSVYDENIEIKSQKLKKLNEEIELQKKMQVSEGTEFQDNDMNYILLSDTGATYKNDSFARDYALVKNTFKDEAYEAMSKKVNELLRTRRDLNVHEYREIQNIFSQEMQYEMMTLPPECKREIIELISANSVAKKKILNSYSERYGVFKFKEFMEYVEQYIYVHDSTIRIYSNTGEPCFEEAPPQIVYLKDSSIAEGYIVRFRDRVYDFSI